ncbi:hypothetical protein ZWY2020_009219 [Hordeum vulgare]|nr:hypothetical protein ZWY2020_009219 [Hordeum vulgare]
MVLPFESCSAPSFPSPSHPLHLRHGQGRMSEAPFGLAFLAGFRYLKAGSVPHAAAWLVVPADTSPVPPPPPPFVVLIPVLVPLLAPLLAPPTIGLRPPRTVDLAPCARLLFRQVSPVIPVELYLPSPPWSYCWSCCAGGGGLVVMLSC